jgi:hypothetical protein
MVILLPAPYGSTVGTPEMDGRVAPKYDGLKISVAKIVCPETGVDPAVQTLPSGNNSAT